MNFRKLISIWALLALLLGQIALAEHSVSHIDHGFSEEIVALHDNHDGHDHSHGHEQEDEEKEHKCPECLLVKSLQVAFYNAPIVLFLTPHGHSSELSAHSFSIISNRYRANSPRAPPAILI